MDLDHDTRVQALVARPVVYVHPNDTLRQLTATFVEESIGAALVRGPHGTIGLVTERDVVLPKIGISARCPALSSSHMRVRPKVVNLDENALNIFTDGSSYSGPRRGGVGFRIVVVDENGEERTYDEQPPGYEDGTNQQMELMACIEALTFVVGRYSPVDPHDFTKVVIYTDSMYVANNLDTALYTWQSNGWMTRDGNPVENAKLWKQLVAAVFKVDKKVLIKWHKGHSTSNPHNNAVDQLAKKSAKGALRRSPSMTRVRRKHTDRATELGSVRPEGQRITIRIISDKLLPLQHLYMYKYEVMSAGSPHRGNIDHIYSDVMLHAGHEYYVRLNNDPKRPRIEKLFRERKPVKK